MPPDSPTSRPLPLRELRAWDAFHDVVVVGQGVAGGAAAIEAARAGVDTVVLERMTRGGGATALSTGITYFGGGTSIQKACGFEDGVEDMRDSVIVAGALEPDTGLFDSLRERVPEAHAVGDCTGLGLVKKAIEEGARAACAL